MPFQSEKQRRYMHANLPEIAKRWESDYAGGGITRLGHAFGGHPGASHEGVGSGQTSSGGSGEGQETNRERAIRTAATTRTAPPSDPRPGGGDPGMTYTKPPVTGGESPFAYTKLKKDKKEDSSGFLIDVRKKNRKKYLDLLRKYKTDDFDIKNIIRRKSKLSDEETKFIEPYGTTIWEDMAKTVPEKFFNLYETGVAPKVDPTKIVSPRQYEWAKADPSLIEELSTKDYSDIEGQLAFAPGSKKDKKLKALHEERKGVIELQQQGMDIKFSPKKEKQYQELLKEDKEQTKEPKTLLSAQGGVARKNYFHGGILGINESEEIISDDGNDIELTAYNAAFDDPNDLSTGVRTLFRAKDGGRIGFFTGMREQEQREAQQKGPPGGGDPQMTYTAPPPTHIPHPGVDTVETLEEQKEIDSPENLRQRANDMKAAQIYKVLQRKDLTKEEKWEQAKYTWEELKKGKKFVSNIKKGAAVHPVIGLLVGIFEVNKLKKEQVAEIAKLEKQMGLLEEWDQGARHHAVETPMSILEQRVLDLTQPSTRDDTGGPGGPPSILNPVTLQVGEEYAQGYPDFDAYKWIKEHQAARTAAVPDWQLTAEERELKNNPIVMTANSGGLANLFRVKNQ